MNAGYASDSKKGTLPGLPGSKLLTHDRGRWGVVDVYIVTRLSSQSGGTTIISYDGVPVWMMQYFGWYKPVAIPCLKAALKRAYGEEKFYAGRGPLSFEYEGFLYRNWVKMDMHFQNEFHTSFRGSEDIHDKEGVLWGMHRFHGGIMF
jgi:hypothetical protein